MQGWQALPRFPFFHSPIIGFGLGDFSVFFGVRSLGRWLWNERTKKKTTSPKLTAKAPENYLW